MKKLMIVAAVALLAMTAVSCSKTCNCTTVQKMDGVTVQTLTSEGKTTGKCSDLNTTSTVSNPAGTIVQTTTCK
jgi:hypothetical protein